MGGGDESGSAGANRRADAFVFAGVPPPREGARAALEQQYLADEETLLRPLLPVAELAPAQRAAAVARAGGWVQRLRRDKARSPFDAFLQEYDLSSPEGLLLMGLAEALLRIPDEATAERLIAGALTAGEWERHLGQSESLLVNASTWALLLGDQLVTPAAADADWRTTLRQLLARSTEPVLRAALRRAMRLLGAQFVMGRRIGEALRRAQRERLLCSFDMLGEAALTREDAARYRAAYEEAIAAIGAEGNRNDAVTQRPGLSVKLSALHPRYEFAQRGRVLQELQPVLLALAQQARAANIALTVDAEEADRLELSLDLTEAVYRYASLAGWEGFGLAVQAYQKRSLALIDWLEQLARQVGRCLQVRLVKGAYWDTEIKRAQELGLASYPVFTRKAHTDVAWLAAARRLLAARPHLYPMLATHNAYGIAAARELAGDDHGYEFQRLQGMGEALYERVAQTLDVPCRVYAPVGAHEELLPYLVRRLLENGANSSFVHRIFDERVPATELLADPVEQARATLEAPPAIVPPPLLYGDQRRNARGWNLASEPEAWALAAALATSTPPPLAQSRLAGITPQETPRQPVLDPSDHRRRLGEWMPLPPAQVPDVLRAAAAAQPAWEAQPVDVRARLLESAAERLENAPAEFLWLLVREAGKTLPDAIAELREAVDALRYYASLARQQLRPQPLPGPTGEYNELQLHGRGVFACISPWNFPLAIFGGQIAAALVSGNCVVAKPAEQTNLVAQRFVELLHGAGIPVPALQLVLGAADVGAALVSDARVTGVAFTGSVEVAQQINRRLAARDGPIGVLIAETGGQNAMIVDSSALPEQVVKDVLVSAFNSAGQRCSALRVLYLQEEIAERVILLLRGAMQELVVGDPALLATDVGPVIDVDAQRKLEQHLAALRRAGRIVAETPLPAACAHGTYIAPVAAAIDGIRELEAEHFGPVLHLVRYRAEHLERVIDDINASHYGLTLGLHSRIESNWRRLQARARVGNCYVNRGMTGAVIGVQPFGGEGLSGTGPKVGGPHTLLRFVTERTLSVNTAAVGGNAALLAGRS